MVEGTARDHFLPHLLCICKSKAQSCCHRMPFGRDTTVLEARSHRHCVGNYPAKLQVPLRTGKRIEQITTTQLQGIFWLPELEW